ncbi:hypothetical protein D6745_03695 [Candidatus Woesearchaeota archaeon]|nr:MAG: hypothetical protein D6745_03695 [Candidatus Woesearchaeota archaeon]
MESLEVALRRIWVLKKGLEANVEEGHYEEQYIDCDACVSGDSSSAGSCWGSCDCHNIPQKVWVVDEIKPDVKKRNAARNELIELYNSSEWYSVRYKAAKALEVKDLEERIPHWVSELADLLDPSKTAEPLMRVRAVQDAGALMRLYSSPELMQLMKNAYEKDPQKIVRVAAGKELGYNKLRIIVDEMFKLFK